ncbi:MAG: diguanylate cyclase [Marinagarivorans sp.]|nr:diguanylate cyclase [Marinagarivorans sp.]
MKDNAFIQDFHWLMDVLQYIDVGLVVLDEDYNIQLWNSFMQNHSARLPTDVLGNNVFSIFPELPEVWFKRKVHSVRVLHNSAFTTWEQRPYLFKFRNYRPVTGTTEFMYQNCTILPLTNVRGEITHVCLIIYDVTEVAANRLQLQRANSKLHIISQTDGLTGLLNRKYWEEGLTHEFKRFQRYKHNCSLIMLDIDHFKRINDTYGHPAGDEIIRNTAQILKNNLRDIDICGRYGGEEFTVTLVDTNLDGAMLVAERLRAAIERNTIYYDEHVINYTISIGIAEIKDGTKSHTEWIEHADKGLYRAKRAGRNQTQIYSGE